MAVIRRHTRELDAIAPIPSLGTDPQNGELRFIITLGAYGVSISRRERDKIMNTWKVLLEEYENGKRI